MDSPNFASSDHIASPTLYDTLITVNRTLYYDNTSSNGSLSFQTVYIRIPMEVMHWDDFNIQSLTEAYRDTLSSSLEIQSSERYSSPPQISGLDTLKWVCKDDILQPVRQAMEKGTEDIVGRLSQRMPNVEVVLDDHIPSTRGYSSGLSLLLGDGTSTSTTPAHLVVSCFYHASTWHSNLLLQGHTPLHLIPLRHLATYCLLSNTRYSFIFTSEEIVVVRVSGTKAGHYWASCRVEWRSIPWGASGPGVLTVKFSLWSLFMMSLQTKYRAICTPERILPVHLWWRYRNCEGRVVFRHHLSMREVFQRPIGAVVEDVSLNL